MKKITRVLIIDDDPVYCRLLDKGLGRLGYQCNVAHNTAQVLSIEDQQDVILLDMRLGEESGLGLIPDLQRTFPGSKFIMVTGYANLATAVTAVKKGASNYIAKPVDVKDIHAIIQESLFGDDTQETDTAPIPGQAPSLKRLEWEHIHRVLEENEGNISRTAQKLGMHRRTLQRKLKKHAP
jgi:two-component system response regulator RegA